MHKDGVGGRRASANYFNGRFNSFKGAGQKGPKDMSFFGSRTMLNAFPSMSPNPIAGSAQLHGANRSSLVLSLQPAMARTLWGTCRGRKGRRAVGASRRE